MDHSDHIRRRQNGLFGRHGGCEPVRQVGRLGLAGQDNILVNHRLGLQLSQPFCRVLRPLLGGSADYSGTSRRGSDWAATLIQVQEAITPS